MSVSVKGVEQLDFRGVYTAGNPIQRPRNTAAACQDLRVMPGNYLRLRSGRVARYKTTGQCINIAPFRMPGSAGSDSQLAQMIFAGSPVWHWFTLLSYLVLPGFTDIEPIAVAYDGGFSLSNPAAATNLSDRPVFYNGLGIRGGGRSRPALSAYVPNSGTRFFGLDCYSPTGTAPTVTHTPGAGWNKCLSGLALFVGLWHAPTDHYSNGLFMGSFGTLPAGTISVANLSRLSYATHGAGETSELYYVFYATIDGGTIPYLILNSTLTGPYAVPVTVGSTTLNIDGTADNGWNLDETKETPTENFPPRPMRSITYVNGRLYGVLMAGAIGDSGGRDFTYAPTPRDMAAVCWSAAAGDAVEADFLGDPLQSWPLWNLQYTPSADQPLVVAPAEDAQGTPHVLVITPTATFYLEEQADGIHEWVTVSRVHGISRPQTLRATQYGLVWVDQRNQIVKLAPGSRDVQVLSTEYQSLLTGRVVKCADYVLDPAALVDRYQVWLDNATSVCHDFVLGGPGVAYTATNQDYTAAVSATDLIGRQHHVVVKDAFYTHEVQPDTGGVPVTDATFQNDGSVLCTEINGQYTRNWDDFGDSDIRKELPSLDIVGDGDPAASLAGVSPLSLEWYGDFEQVTPANKKTVTGQRIVQSVTNPTYRFKLAAANKFWYKLVFKLTGHSTEYGGINASYPDPATEGDLARNFVASVLRVLWRLGSSSNRA